MILEHHPKNKQYEDWGKENRIIRFHFEPIDDEEDGTDIFVEMIMPVNPSAYNEKIKEIEDCILSFLDTFHKSEYDYQQMVLDVTRSFDEQAKICDFSTIYV